MASKYRKVLRKLNLEHSLGLFDPDLPDDPVANSADYQLCRDAKDLWQEDSSRLDRVFERFEAETRDSGSQWLNKPNADPTTLPGDAGNQTMMLKKLLRRLLANESDQSISATTTAQFHLPNEHEISYATAYQHDQPATEPAFDARFSDVPGSNSSDMVSAPDSSWTREYVFREHYNFARASEDHMDMDSREQDSPPPSDQHATDIINDRSATVTPEKSPKKRPASLHEREEKHKSRSFNDAQLRKSVLDQPVYSFFGQPESFTTNGTHRKLARASTTDTSFRSVATEVNESFVSNTTPPSTQSSEGHDPFRSRKSAGLYSDAAGLSDKAKRCLARFTETTPFDSSLQACPKYLSLPTRYEVQRVALHNDFHVTDTAEALRHQTELFDNSGQVTDLNRFWGVLSKYVNHHQGSMPAKSSDEAWNTFFTSRKEFPYSRIYFSGVVSFREKPADTESLLKMKLHPLVLQQSNRLKRKYGGDRVMVLDFPSLEPNELPKHLEHDATDMRLALVEWLSTTSHYLFGQEWRAFYVKSKVTAKSSEKRIFGWKVYFFAVNGHDFKTYDDNVRPQQRSIDRMLDWFFSTVDNQDQPLLKLFSRIQLMVTDTLPTITFKHSEIILQDDIKFRGVLMTDGCARISMKAAQAVSIQLNLSLPYPSAFQGRIAGAKGMWIVDNSLEPRNGSEIWIEMSPSQIKFNGLSRDKKYVDKHRVTFDVHDYSRPLRPAPINFQFLPILIDRNVKPRVFTELLEADLNEKVAELDESMSRPQALRAWNQEQYPTGSVRLSSNGVVWEGGMPKLDHEQINALVEAGFVPETCATLRDLCRSAVQAYCTRIEERMNIFPGQTTFAYMVPDFWGVLEENQIHLGFSSAFKDKKRQWSDTMLHSIDLLVARCPAVLPSDIHKVRAVFKSELAHLKDVIVFPTKGSFCLADKLSGGDYDGDKAWICWNPVVVESFRNFDTPPKKDYSYYGIKRDKTRVGDVWPPRDVKESGYHSNQVEEATEFIKQGMEFNMRRSLLGPCTNLHEAHCYALVLKAGSRKSSFPKYYSPMCEPIVMELASLLGHLVDTAKNGYTFGNEEYGSYLRSIGIPRLSKRPAYKDGGEPADHIIDQLVLVTAVNFRQAAMRKLDLIADPSMGDIKDKDLLKVYQEEKALAERSNDLAISLVLQQLHRDIASIYARWSQMTTMMIGGRGNLSWSQACETVRTLFLDLQPASGVRNGLDLDAHPVVQRWQQSRKFNGHCSTSSWYLLAASAFYSKFSKATFPWRACGKELLQLKLLANNDGVPMARQMHQYMKFDTKMWSNAQLRGSDETGLAAENEVMDEDEFLAFDAESMYEYQAGWE